MPQPGQAGGWNPQIETLINARLEALGITTNGTYTPPASPTTATGWTATGGLISLTTPTDGVGIGTSSATTKLNVLGDGTRKNIALTGGDGAASGTGGVVNLTGGVGGTTHTAGTVNILGGPGGTTSGAGGGVTIRGGLPVDGAGGTVTIEGRAGVTTTATNRNGGAVTISAGNAALGGTAGAVTITGGQGGTTGTAGAVSLIGGAGATTGGTGGGAGLSAGTGGANGNGGLAAINGGASGLLSGNGGNVNITGGLVQTAGNGGGVNITGSPGAGAAGNGGSVTITSGVGSGTGTIGGILLSGRVQGQQGADVASGNDMTLSNGNYFDLNGNGTINGIATAGWRAGSVVTMQCDGAPTFKNATAASAGFASMALAGAADFVASAGDTLTLIYDGTVWREIARAVI